MPQLAWLAVTVGAECWAGGWWCQSLEMCSVLILIILTTAHSHTATTPQPTPPTTSATAATAAERRRLGIIMITLLAIAGVLGSSLGSVEAANSVTIDLSKAMLDEESGNYCVIQKVGGRSLLMRHLIIFIKKSKTIENLILCCLNEM